MMASSVRTEKAEKPLHAAILSRNPKRVLSVAVTLPTSRPTHVTHISGLAVTECYQKLRSAENCEQVTPLLAAVHLGDLDMCNWLIEEGADVNIGKVTGMDPLRLALIRRLYDVARLLIASGADVKKVDEEGKTPTYYAILPDSPARIVGDLMSAGVSKEDIICFEENNTILTTAIAICNIPVMDFILKKGVNIETVHKIECNYFKENRKAFSKITPLGIAVLLSSLTMTEKLLKYGAKVEGHANSYLPLFLAVQSVNINVFKAVVRQIPNINTLVNPTKTELSVNALKFNMNGTILHMALSFLNFEAALYLLENGADPKATDSDLNLTSLHVLSLIMETKLDRKQMKTYKKVVQMVLDAGADPWAVSKYGVPIANIMGLGNFIAIEELIKSGVDVNKPVGGGMSLLHFSVIRRITRLVKLCIDFGGDCSKSFHGQSVFELAIKGEVPEILSTLIKHAKSKSDLSRNPITILFASSLVKVFLEKETQLFEGLINNDPDQVSNALENGAAAYGSWLGLKHPLHFVTHKGYSGLVETMLNDRFPPSCKNSSRATPLHLAAWFGFENICKSLLRFGACYNHRGPKGATPLRLAELKTDKGSRVEEVKKITNEDLGLEVQSTFEYFEGSQEDDGNEGEQSEDPNSNAQGYSHDSTDWLSQMVDSDFDRFFQASMTNQNRYFDQLSKARKKCQLTQFSYSNELKSNDQKNVDQKESSTLKDDLNGKGKSTEYVNRKTTRNNENGNGNGIQLENHQGIVKLLRMVGRFFKMARSKDISVIKELESTADSVDVLCFLNCVNSKGNTLLGEAISAGAHDVAEGLMKVRLKLRREIKVKRIPTIFKYKSPSDPLNWRF